jgi:hypothetical protein
MRQKKKMAKICVSVTREQDASQLGTGLASRLSSRDCPLARLDACLTVLLLDVLVGDSVASGQ